MQGTSGEGATPPLFPVEVTVRGLRVTQEQYEANIRHALGLGLKELRGMVPPHKLKWIVCGGGPSMQETLPRIKVLKRLKQIIVAVNGTHDWLIERGIIPTCHVIIDAEPKSAEWVRKPHPEVTYLIASQCDPSVFEALKGQRVVLWHAWQGMNEDSLLKGHPTAIIAGGSTVALRAVNLGYVFGARAFELHGVDSCFWEGESQHVYGGGDDAEGNIWCRVGKRYFRTSHNLGRQAQDFALMLKTWGDVFKGASLEVYGRGVLKAILKDALKKERRSGRRNFVPLQAAELPGVQDRGGEGRGGDPEGGAAGLPRPGDGGNPSPGEQPAEACAEGG